MTKSLWINLPVKDVKRSREFYSKVGFTLADGPGNTETSASFIVGEQKVVLMLFEEAQFEGFTSTSIADTSKGCEVLFSIDAENKEEVDLMAERAVKAGGTSPHQPSDMTGWMYGSLFIDPDGHRWNVLYMDMSQMPG